MRHFFYRAKFKYLTCSEIIIYFNQGGRVDRKMYQGHQPRNSKEKPDRKTQGRY